MIPPQTNEAGVDSVSVMEEVAFDRCNSPALAVAAAVVPLVVRTRLTKIWTFIIVVVVFSMHCATRSCERKHAVHVFIEGLKS